MVRHQPLPGLCLIAFLALLLAACGRGEELPAPDLTPVVITYLSFGGATQGQTEEVVIERFEESHPGIQVTRESYGQQPQNYLLATPPPDVMFLWTGYLFSSARRNGLLADVSDIWNEAGFDRVYPDIFREMSRFEGNLYFVPGGYSWTALYYNRVLFDRYGLAPPQTWEEFLQVCDTLLANGETPLTMAGQSPFVGTLWFDYLDMRLNGPAFHRDLMAGGIDYTDPRVATVLETWRSLIDRGYFVPGIDRVSEMESMAGLVRGDVNSPLTRRKAVMALATPFTVNNLPPALRDELNFFRFPIMDLSLPVGEASITFGYVIPAGVPNRPQAGVFLRYLGSVEAEELLVQQADSQVGWAPVHRDFDRSLLNPYVEQGEAIVQSADNVGPPFFLSLPSSMTTAVGQAVNRFLRGNGDIAGIQLMLEDARRKAIQQGELTPP